MARRFLVLVSFLSLLALLPLGAQDKTAGPEIVAKLKGHTDAVYAVAYSPDGKFLVTASFDNTLKLWDPFTGKEIKTYGGAAGHTKQVIAVGFNQDGSMIASGSTDNSVKVWDVPINAPIRSFKTTDSVQAVALSLDGLKLAIGGKDGSLKLVTPTEFKELVKFEAGHQGAITALSFSTDGLMLASVGVDRTLRYWDAAKGQLLATIGAHTGGVNNVVRNPNNSAVYTVGDDGFLKFWQLPPPPLPKTMAGHAAPIRALALTADGATYYTGSDDKTVRQFAIAGAKEVRTLSGPQASVTSVATHPANTFIAAGTADSKIFLWNSADPKVPVQWLAHAGAVNSMQMQATTLMSAGGDGLIKFWALPPVLPKTLPHPDAVLAAVASPDGKKLFTGSNDKFVRVWDTTKQAMEKQLAGHTAPVTAVAVSPNLQILASGGADNTIRLWNQATAKESDVLLAHTAPITALGLNPTGTQMLSASEDGAVKLWTLPLVAPKPFVHPDSIAALIVSPDGAKMLTAGNDKIVRLWNLTSGAKEKDYAGPTLPINALAMTNAMIAAASADKTVTIWNAADAKVLHKLPMPAVPQAVQFSGDAQSLFVGLADNTIKQIKVADGKEIKTLPAQHKAAIVGLALSPKGDMLYSASADKTIQTWALPDGTPKAKFDHVAPLLALALSKDGTRLAGLAEKTVKIWTVADGKEIGTLKLSADAKGISLSPDGTRVIVAGGDKLARIYAIDGQLLETLPHDGPVQGVAFVDAKKVVTGGGDKLARLWTSSLLWTRQHQGPVRQALFTPKGDQVFSAGDDKTIKIWNAADGKEGKTLSNETPITHLSLSGDATKVATASPLTPNPSPQKGEGGMVVKIWTIADGKTSAAIALPAVVQSLSLSPNAQRIAVALQDGPNNVVRVHDIALGKDVQIFTEHTGPVKTLQYLGDGRTLVTASVDKTARLLDVGVVSALAAHPAGPTFAQYNGAGTQLLSAGADKTIKLWDLAKANAIKTFGPVVDPIKAIAFSKDFTKIGVAAGKNVKVWNIADSKELATLSHAVEVLSLTFNVDGSRIATGAADKQTRLWEVATGKEMQFFAQDDAVAAVLALPNNGYLSAAGKGTRLDTSAILRQIPADAGPVYALTVVPANTHVLTGGADKTVKLWNLTTGAKERDFAGATGPIRSVAISKNSALLAAGGADSTVRVYQFADAKELGSVKVAGEVRALGFTPNNLALVASSAGKTLDAWEVPFAPGQPLAKEFLKPVQSWTTPDVLGDFALSSDNASIYSGGQDKALHVWKLASPAPTRNFNYGVPVDAVAFQPNGTLLAAAGHDGKVRFFDLVKNAQTKEINAHISVIQKNNVPQPVYSLEFSPDGKQILSSSYDNSIKLWDVASGNLVKEFKPHKEKEFEKGHQEPVYTAVFSPDGKFIASGSSGLERTIKIWNIDGSVARDLANPSYKTAANFPPASHPGAVTNLRFTKDGKYLISVGDAPGNKGFLAVWDWQAGKMVASETLQLGVFYGLALSPDQKTLAVTAGNRDRKLSSPEFNAAYLLKLPMLK